MRRAELGDDRRDAGEGAGRRHQQDHEAAVVLHRGGASDVLMVIAQHHRIDQHEIDSDQCIPAEQKPCHQPV